MASPPAFRLMTPHRARFFSVTRSPFCEAPKTENDPNCSALAPKPANISGMYPAAIQADAGFCSALEKRPDAVALLNQFSIVSEKAGGRATGNPATDELVAVPYHVAYADDMKAVSNELRAAAALLAGRSVGGARSRRTWRPPHRRSSTAAGSRPTPPGRR